MNKLKKESRESYRKILAVGIARTLQQSDPMTSLFATVGVALSRELDCDDHKATVALLQEIYVEAMREVADGLADTAESARKAVF